jgi:ATP-dependent exoDNAse (exonuclease V) alpha subunit
MDFFHCSIGHVSRSQGRSAVQNVAYNTGEVLYEDRRELQADYANNRGAFWETMAPEGSGIAADDLSFWDKLETHEDSYARQKFLSPATVEKYMTSARTAQTYEISLPKELSKEQQIDLIREMIATRFVSLGLMATYAIHEDEGNPHVHVTVSTRTVWGGKISSEKGIARHLTSRYEFRESRRIFAELINKHQELAGLPDRVDYRSYADRGIELIPTYHKGWNAHQLEKEEKYSRIVTENREITQENKERIAHYPEIILRELTSKQATFSERDVVKLVHKRLGDETGALASHVIHSVLKQAVEVGIGFDDLKRYTSLEYKEKEDQVLVSFQNYLGQKASVAIDGAKVGTLLEGEASWLNEGQKNAVKTLCSDAKVAVMVGRAGTGKTTALQYVVQLHKQAGYEVLGMAPSATAAHELAKGAGCESDTIAHHAWYWRAYHQAIEKLVDKNITDKERQYFEKLIAKYEKRLPTKNTLILVDEAGMVGIGGADNPIAGGWDAIIKTVNATGCKLILVGDDCQFKPVEAGDVFRKFVEVLKEKGSLCTLDQIQRQTVPWMREASVSLSELKTGEALGMYERQGHIQQYDTDGQVYQEMARQYLRNLTREPDSENIVLAYTNAEIRELNGAIRKILKENGLLAVEDILHRPQWTSLSSERTEPGSQAMGVGNADKGGDKGFARKAQELNGIENQGNSHEENAQKERNPEEVNNNNQDHPAVFLAPDSRVLIPGESEAFTVGDRIVFTKNDRGFWTKFQSPDPSFFVRNGTQAVIQSITPCRTKDRETGGGYNTHKIVATVGGADAKDKTTVWFYPKEYPHFQHGYAVTTHKSQGATADGALLKASPYMDAHAFYVALTRHRNDVGIYYSKSDLADFSALVKAAGKVSDKDLAVDYTVGADRESYWANVQEYKALGRELLSIRTFGKHADKTDKAEQLRIWEQYETIKLERKELAKLILTDWENHRDIVRQAGLTFETLEIAAGLRKRSLSRLEAQAQEVVEQYAGVAIDTRETWRSMRKTHPGIRAKTHPEWTTFEALRDQRGILANQIIQNPALYRPLLRETALAWEDGTDKVGKNHFGYGIVIIKVQAEAHQSKMLQQEMLKYTSDPVHAEKLQTLLDYVEARDLAASLWKDLRPKLKAFEGTLLSQGFAKEIDEWKGLRMARDQQAAKIVDHWEDYASLFEKLGMKLDFDKLFEQKEQAVRDALFKTYMASEEAMAKFQAAAHLKVLMDEESKEGKKLIIAQTYQWGLQPKDIAEGAREYQKLVVFQSLATDDERQLFTLLEEYDDKCRAANRLYVQCLVVDAKNQDSSIQGLISSQEAGTGNNPETDNNVQHSTTVNLTPGYQPLNSAVHWKPWDSKHYPAYKAACHARNETALEIFEQRNHEDILKLSNAVGIKFKEVELAEIFARCAQAERTRCIEGYLAAEGREQKGQAAVALLKLIELERQESRRIHLNQDRSKDAGTSTTTEELSPDIVGQKGSQRSSYRVESLTATQIYYAGIDLKDVQATAFTWRREQILASLTGEADIKIFHSLTTYETTTHQAKKAYVACLAEAKEKGIKPWETGVFSQYLGFVGQSDQLAHTLLKSYPNDNVIRIASQMAILLKGLDVEAHRHTLRETLQTFRDGDRTNVPMAATELFHWLDFDKDSGFKRTFKVLREKDVCPQDLQDSLQAFHALKRALKREGRQDNSLKATARQITPSEMPSPNYRIHAYERYRPAEEIQEALSARIQDLATDLLGNPTSRTRNQWRFGRKGSICVNVSGNHQGKYYNFETGTGGSVLNLIQEQQNLASFKDALAWASQWLGENPIVISRRVVEMKQAASESTWAPVFPVPATAPEPDVYSKYLSYMLKEGGDEIKSEVVSRHAYRDEDGNLKGYVFRIQRSDGAKITPPLTWRKNEKGFQCWRWQGFEKSDRSLYGLEKLKINPGKPVLIVEGEKTTDAAQRLLPEYVVVSWCGGAKSFEATDWRPLVSKNVAIWPDNDEVGINAARGIQSKLQEIKAQNALLKTEEKQQGSTISKSQAGIVTLPNGVLPEKWDLADDLPSGWTKETVRQMIRDAIPERNESFTPEKPSSIAPESSHQTAKASRVSKAADRLFAKREQFEKERMPLNQEWIAKFHFYQTNGRFPKPEELEATWWQAERLTAIEGRIYHQGLKQGSFMPISDLRDAAREEFAKREVFQLQEQSTEGQKLLKTTYLTESQALQVQQHILFHQDQTGELPSVSRIHDIINAVKAHAEMRGGQGDQAAKLPDSDAQLAPPASAARFSRQYASLMEQQQLLSGRTSTDAAKAPTAFLSSTDDKMVQLTLQVSSAIESQNRRQRSKDRGRGMEI